MLNYLKIGHYIEIGFLNALAVLLFILPFVLNSGSFNKQAQAQVEKKPAAWADFKISEDRSKFSRAPASEMFE